MNSTISQKYQQLKSKLENLPYLDLIDYEKLDLEYEVSNLDLPIDCISEIVEYLWLIIQDLRNQISWEDLDMKDFENDDGGLSLPLIHTNFLDGERHSILWNFNKVVKELKEWKIELD